MANAQESLSKRRVHSEARRPIEVILVRVVSYFFGVLEVLLGVRFVLKLLGANAEAAFVKLIYSITEMFTAPFVAVFETAQSGEIVFEWTMLLALVVYALIGWGIVELIRAMSPRRSAQTVETVESVEQAQTSNDPRL